MTMQYTGFQDVEDEAVEWENERFARIPIMPPSSCVMFFGKRGSGKSAVMAKMGKDEAALGRKVWYWPKDYRFKYGTYISLEDLTSMPSWLRNGALLLDEIQILASNLRTIATSNQMIGSILQQVRKRGLNIYGTSNQPGRVDGTVSLQTDFHYDCYMMEDPRCGKIGYHRKDCQDHVRMRWTDTNGNYGWSRAHKDGRKRGKMTVWNIRDIYAIYNTGAIADLGEVMSLTKDAILANRAHGQMGMTPEELSERLRTEWIPKLVKEGVKRITPAALASTLKQDLEIKIDARTMGKALGEVGIATVRSNQGRFAMLPPEKYLEMYMRIGDWPRE